MKYYSLETITMSESELQQNIIIVFLILDVRMFTRETGSSIQIKEVRGLLIGFLFLIKVRNHFISIGLILINFFLINYLNQYYNWFAIGLDNHGFDGTPKNMSKFFEGRVNG